MKHLFTSIVIVLCEITHFNTKTHTQRHTRIHYINVTVFANGQGDRSSIPSRFLLKTQKMVLDTTFLIIQHYKGRIMGEVKQTWEWSNPSLRRRCSSYWKGSLGVVLFTHTHTHTYIYIYIYIYILEIYIIKKKIYIYILTYNLKHQIWTMLNNADDSMFHVRWIYTIFRYLEACFYDKVYHGVCVK